MLLAETAPSIDSKQIRRKKDNAVSNWRAGNNNNLIILRRTLINCKMYVVIYSLDWSHFSLYYALDDVRLLFLLLPLELS